MEYLDRSYFPEIKKDNFNETTKEQVILQINHDFEDAFEGIKKLPKDAKLSVLLAYYYYKNLLQKIEHTPVGKIMETRIRIPDVKKIVLFLKAILVIKFKLI